MEYQVGHGEILRHTFSQEDFDRIAVLSGDDNPIHVDPDFAAKTRFKKTVAHGMLLYGMVSRVIGDFIPGGVPIEQELMFPAPTYTDEEVTVWVVVTKALKDENALELDTYVIKENGDLGLKGRAVIGLEGVK
ncbi:MAG: hypothetical protein JEZ04_03185 [Spirochaetales bacterium]|nr:hypothetical protein [Spirochaetales bacterium]